MSKSGWVGGVLLLGLALNCQHGRQKGPAPSEFDATLAHEIVKRAVAVALVDCNGRVGPPGPGQIEVQFDPAKIASQVRLLPEALGASARGACIERVVRFEASVTELQGSSEKDLGLLPSRPPESVYPRLVTASEPPSQRLDLAALQLGLFRAARQVSEQCRLPGAPTGKGQIRLQVGNDGRVQSSELIAEQFRGTPTGECVQKQFALVSVPPFVGTASPLLKTFVVGDGTPADFGFDYEAAERTLAQNPPGFDAAAAARALREAALVASACSPRDAWGWGEVQVDFLRYGSVDGATLLTQRFQDTDTGSCVANAFRQARVPLFGGPSSVLVQDFEVLAPRQPFDEAKAQQALADAAVLARQCTSKGGPTGPLEVGVRFAPSGHVKVLTVLSPAFRDTLTGSCVRMVFRRARTSSFQGLAPPLFQQLEIPSNPSPEGVRADAG